MSPEAQNAIAFIKQVCEDMMSHVPPSARPMFIQEANRILTYVNTSLVKIDDKPKV